MQSRWKSKVLWASLGGAVIMFLVNSGIIDTGMSEALTTGLNTLITILVSFGIINNPENTTSI